MLNNNLQDEEEARGNRNLFLKKDAENNKMNMWAETNGIKKTCI